jgi:hypothetical protein
MVLRLPRVCPRSKFVTSFKLPPNLVNFLFRQLQRQYQNACPKHLLWTLYYLKTENVGEENIAISLGTNRATLRHYVELTLHRLDAILPDVCSVSGKMLFHSQF